MKQIPTPRDALLFETDTGMVLVSAVDSCGGIGNLPGDALHVSPSIVGLFTARVALLEVLALGAQPAWAALAVSSGPDTAEELITGAKKILGNIPLAVSTEKNMPTNVTGLGVTVTGFCHADALRTACARQGDSLYCAGDPLVGEETLDVRAVLFEPDHLAALWADPRVHALIPVGSRGIAAEAAVLALESSLVCTLDEQCGLNLKKSAGPATCVVFAAQAGSCFDIGLPVREIGTLYK